MFFHLLKVEDTKQFRHFFTLLIVSTVLTFALPIQWFLPHLSLLFINGLGALLQVVMLYKFIQLIKPKLEVLMTNAHKLMRPMFMFALVCFVLKVLFQSLSIFPAFSEVVYEHRNFVIGFIHLLMLGVISGFLFAFILKSTIVSVSRSLNFGIYSFLLGFVLTELLLLIQGVMFYFGNGILPNYYLLLFLFSIFLPLGIGLVLFNIINGKKDN